MSSGLMFPKSGKQKRRKKHAKSSILQREADKRRCWLCMRLNGDYSEHAQGTLHKHHVYMGPLRDVSEAEGFFVWLCPQHHEFGQDAVHKNREMSIFLQKETQKAFERTKTRREFTELTGRSYL